MFSCRNRECPALVEHPGYCPACKSAIPTSSTARGYGALHRKWAAFILMRDPICMRCHRAASEQADHIIPWQRGGAKYDPSNGQGLCAECHGIKTREDALACSV